MKRFLRLVPLDPWKIWLTALGLTMALGLAGGVLVFWKGLIITNLSDWVPWGLWITLDLSSIALAAGAFSLCAGVHLFGLKRYQPLARTALFIGLIGYTMALLALLLDIGRPQNFWHPLVYWNPHSTLWEVTMCVCLYLLVLILENMPTFASWSFLRERFPRLSNRMKETHHLAPFLAVVGLLLSSLHQSSLGAVYGVLKARPIWFKPELSVLFMLSAIIGGISLTVLASMIAARLSKQARINDVLLERTAHFVGYLLIAYFYFRAWDLLATTYTYAPGRSEGLQLLTKGTLSFNFWIGEMILGILVPMVILLYQPARQNPFWRMVALFLIAAGVVAYRWDTNLVGLLVVISYLPGPMQIAYTTYRPAPIEWITTLGILAYGLLAFSLGVKYLRVVDHRWVTEEAKNVHIEAEEVALSR